MDGSGLGCEARRRRTDSQSNFNFPFTYKFNITILKFKYLSVCLSDCLSVCLSCELQLPLGRFRSRGRSSTDPTQLDLRVDEDGGAILSGAWSPRAEVDGGGLTGAKCGGFMELDLATDFAPSPKGRQVTW